MYDLAGQNELDLDALRARLRRMGERELLRFGQAARCMCSPGANLGKEPCVRNPTEGSVEGMARTATAWMDPKK